MNKYDLYSIKPKFLINKGESIASNIGSLLSIFTLILSMIISIFLFKIFFEGKSYTVSFKQEFKQNYNLNLTDKPIFFGLIPMKIELTIEWEKVFKIGVLQVNTSKKKSMEINFDHSNLIIQNCSHSEKLMNKRIGKTPEFFLKFPSWCLASRNNNITIYGETNNYMDNLFIGIVFSKCVNSTENKYICYSKDTIDKVLEKSLFYWGSLDYNINHDLSGDPFEPKFFLDMHEFNHKYLTKLYAKFMQSIYKSDVGWFQKDDETYTKALHDKTEVIPNGILDFDPNAFLRLRIETSGKREMHQRRFQKLQEALAQISVLLNIVRTICAFVISFFGDKIYYEHLINNMLSAEEPENKKRKFEFIKMKQNLLGNFIDIKKPDNSYIQSKTNIHCKDDETLGNLRELNNYTKIPKENQIQLKENTNMNQSNFENSTFRSFIEHSKQTKKEVNVVSVDKKGTEMRMINENKGLVPNNLLKENDSTFDVPEINDNNYNNNNKNIKDSITVQEEKKMKAYFAIGLKDFVFLKFSKNRNSSKIKFESFVSVFKELLSIELFLKEINWFLDIKTTFELQLPHRVKN